MYVRAHSGRLTSLEGADEGGVATAAAVLVVFLLPPCLDDIIGLFDARVALSSSPPDRVDADFFDSLTLPHSCDYIGNTLRHIHPDRWECKVK